MRRDWWGDSHLPTLTAAILVGLLLPGLALGQAFEVTPTATSDQRQPAIAALPNLNQFLVVWQDFQAGSFDISGQVINGNRTRTGSKITIATGANEQSAPAVAYNSTTNQFLVVWQDFQAGTLFDISGQLVSTNGSLVGAKITISNAANDQTVPAVAYNATTDQFLVVWQDFQAGTLFDISGQLVNANGTLVGAKITISNAANDQTVPAVALNPTTNQNQFLVVWQDFQFGTLSDIAGQLVNANGTLSGTRITVSNAANDQTAPTVTYHAVTNQFFSVWQDLRSGGFSDIFGQLVNATGGLVGANFAIPDTAPPSNRTAPAVAFNETTIRFLVVWEEGALTNILGRRLTTASNGTVTFEDGAASAIPSAALSSDRTAPALAFNVNANQFVVVWQDAQGGLTTDIVGQMTGGGGTATPPIVTVTSPDGAQTLTVGVSFTITWTSDDTDIATQEIRLSKDGGLTFPTVIETNLGGAVRSRSWIPTSADTTTQGRVRVTATDTSVTPATGLDASNAKFTVAAAGAGGTGTVPAECAIATAALGSPLAVEVQTLRTFRDRYLLPHAAGRWAVAAYYRASPPVAETIRRHDALRAVTRGLLWPLVWWAQLALAAPALAVVLGGAPLVGGPLLLVWLLRRRRPRATTQARRPPS